MSTQDNKLPVTELIFFLILKEIVRGRSLDGVLERLPDIWRNLFRVMDDIKESVRLAAAKTVAALSRACIKMCDVAQYPKSGEAAVRSILVNTIF